MSLKPLRIGDLFAKIPIVQGGMGVGISLSELASAVALEGGVGVISSAHIGFDTPGFEDDPLKTNLEALARHIRVAKEKAKGGVIGVNIMTALRHYDDYVRQCTENRADIIFSGAGLPIGLPALVKGTATKIAPIVSSTKAAKVLMKMWENRYGVTADAIVVEGPKAGGHLGFKRSELMEEIDFDAELSGIMAFVKTLEARFNKAIPVIFGGGVSDGNDVKRYMSLGCDGVQVASRYVATDECDAHYRFKEAYVKAKKEDVVIVDSPVGMPGRALLNDFVRRARQGRQPSEKCYGCLTPCDPGQAPYCIAKALVASARGDAENGLVFCGAEVHKINEITSVKALTSELAGD